ncbi:MAG: alpha/beta fold hydrolase [Cellulosilyticaceae bacterium]
MNEKIVVKINDMEQGMFLKSENVENPVLLFLHGGPGSPEIAFTQQYPTDLEKIFTVCWWEQRGSGMSYHRNTRKQTLTIEQMISDTIAVVNYLRRRFDKEKIYIMGHSWGSLVGVLTVQRAPELFHAYIGIGQVARQLESERLAYTFMMDKFEDANNKKMLRKLEKFPIDKGGKVSLRYLSVRSACMMKLGIGVMHNSTSMMDCVMTVLRYKGYTWKEKMKFPIGSSFSLKCLWDAVIQIDLIKTVPELKVPIYVFQGKFDYQVSYTIAREFLDAVEAPIKGFYTFENSAHSPCFEEPEKMLKILREDVLQGKSNGSDKLDILND